MTLFSPGTSVSPFINFSNSSSSSMIEAGSLLNSLSVSPDSLPYHKVILTGDRPTGPLHLGHYVGSLTLRLQLQYNNQVYVLIADTQTLNNDPQRAQNAKRYTLELMKDYLSVGLCPEKICFIRQSDIPELFELSAYLSNFMSLPQVMRIPTIKQENAAYNQSLSMGFLNYPVSQAADILLFNAEYVPVGADQVPILEFANDVRDKFHHMFDTTMFSHIKPLLSTTPRLSGTKGEEKMSKSLNNAIFLSEDSLTLKNKVNSLYTDPHHIRVSDPGRVEGNKVFEFLDIFHNNSEEISELKAHYQKGGLGDTTLKKLLLQDLEVLLTPIREKRATLKDTEVLDILAAGTAQARETAKENLRAFKDILFGQ